MSISTDIADLERQKFRESTATPGAPAVAVTALDRLLVAPQLYDGASYNPQRGNAEGTLLASAARTAQISSADQTNYNARGVAVFLDVSAASGTGGLSVRIQAKDPVSGNYVNVNASPTAVTATGTTWYVLYPGTSGVGTQSSNGPLARTWRVTVFVGDSSSYTYSVGYCLIN